MRQSSFYLFIKHILKWFCLLSCCFFSSKRGLWDYLWVILLPVSHSLTCESSHSLTCESFSFMRLYFVSVEHWPILSWVWAPEVRPKACYGQVSGGINHWYNSFRMWTGVVSIWDLVFMALQAGLFNSYSGYSFLIIHNYYFY